MTPNEPNVAKPDQRPHGRFRADIDAIGYVALAGELDVSRLDELRAALDQALLGSGAVLPVDVTELSFIDPAALSELLRYQLLAVSRQRMFCLESITDPVAMVLDFFDLGHIFCPDDDSTARVTL